MEIVFLGTGCMQPTKERNHAGVLLLTKGEGLLFDCGEGTQRQLRHAGIKPPIIQKIFITHWHGDHVLGIPGLIQTLSALEYQGRLQIYGPKGTKKFIENIMATFMSKNILPFDVVEVQPGIVLEEEGYVIQTSNLQHSAPCVGYAFVEKDVRKIRMRDIRAHKIPDGPLIGKLQRGEEIVFKGKKITPEEVSYIKKGKKIAYVTDTRPCDGALHLARDADVLIIESTYASDKEDKALQYYHLTAKEAALIANQANVKKCILTHFSVRYKEVQQIEEDARVIFDNTQTAKDFMRIKV